MRGRIPGFRLALVALLVLVYGWALFDPISSTRADYPFSPNVRVNPPVPGWSEVDGEIVGGQPNQAFAVWATDADAHIHFASTLDGGETWGPGVRVSDLNHTPGVHPNIAVGASGNLFVVWNEATGLFFGMSSDGGATWSDPSLPVGDGNALPAYAKPALAASGSGNVFIAWIDGRNGNSDVYFTASADGGSTWITPNRRVDDDGTAAGKGYVDMAVDSAGDLYVSWEDYRLGGGNVFVSRSTNGGMAWSANVQVTQEVPGKAYQPSIAAGAPGAVYVAWADIRRENDIYFAKSTDSGASWTNPNILVNTDQTPGDRAHPAVVVDVNGRPSVAWHIQPMGPPRIEFATSSDGGSSWTSPELRVNDADFVGDHYDNPVAAVDGTGRVYVAWEDGRNGAFDLDIYHAHFDPSASPPFPSFPAVEGFYPAMPGILHVLANAPGFNYTYLDYDGDPMTQDSVNVWDAAGTSWLWGCNRTLGTPLPPGSGVSLTFGQPPCPPAPALQDGTSYLLRIRVRDDTGLWSTEVSVPFHQNEVLSPLPPLVPADGSFVPCSSAQTLTWSSPGLDAEGDTPTFRWEVAWDPSFATLLNSGTGPSTMSAPIDTCPTGTFYWRVRVNDGWETGAWGNPPSGYWTFTSLSSGVLPPPRIVEVDASATVATVRWTMPLQSSVQYYAIFGGPTPTALNLTTPLVNVSSGTLEWTDLGRPASADEYYYVVRAFNDTANTTSRTSNTAGWFARSLDAGPNAISLPLQSLAPTKVSDLRLRLGASAVSWMDATGRWVRYDGTNPLLDHVAAIGVGYVADLATPARVFLTGEPGAMVAHRQMRFPDLERTSLTATVTGVDVTLTFASPPLPGLDIVLYRAGTRQGVPGPGRTEVARFVGPGSPASYSVLDASGAATPGERCYIVVAQDSFTGDVDSTYSVCVAVISVSGVASLGLPLRPPLALDVYDLVSGTPGIFGVLWMDQGRWIPHFADMPPGVYDAPALQGVGYQVQVRATARMVFVGD